MFYNYFIKGEGQMQTIKPIIFCALTLGILSTTQTDAFARGMPHEHFRPEIPRIDNASKLHTVLKHPEEITSGAVSGAVSRARKEVKPEVLTSHGIVNQDDVGAAHPESRTKSAAMTKCAENPGKPGC